MIQKGRVAYVSAVKLRMAYGALAVTVIGAGLLCRWPGLHLPHATAKYGGSILWGMMVYLSLRIVLPRTNAKIVAGLAAALAAAVEFSQLLHWPWLDAIRSTTPGVLLIGRYFSWWDIASYWIGIIAVVVADCLCRTQFHDQGAAQTHQPKRELVEHS